MSSKNPSHTHYEVLALTSRGPSHGYDLAAKHSEYFGIARRIPFGQIYATLKRLEKDELVQTFRIAQEGGPQRVEYVITNTGNDVLHDWLRRFNFDEPVETSLRKVLALRIALPLTIALQLLDAYVEQLNDHLEGLPVTQSNGIERAIENIDVALKGTLLAWMRDIRSAGFFPMPLL